MVKRTIGLLGAMILLLAPAMTRAQVSYVDLDYRAADTLMPEGSGWIGKLLDGENRSAFLVVSIFRRGSGDAGESLLLPPRILERLERADGEFRRFPGDDPGMLKAHPVEASDRLVLKLEFFSVRKARARAFAESLESLSAAYAAAGATPQASAIVVSAMDAMASVLLNNRAIYLSYSGSLETRASNTVTLYFDDSGNINDELFAGADAAQRVVFELAAVRRFAVDFNASFLSQGPNEAETIAYIRLSRAASSGGKRAACMALRGVLRQRFSGPVSQDLIAIALNDIKWPQDETRFYCLEPNDAIRYRRKHGLRHLSNCANEECAMTKMLLILLQGDAPGETLASVAGVDIDKLECRTATRFSGLSRWSGVEPSFDSPHYKSFKARSCLTVGGARRSYEHEFSWLNGSLVTHKCEVLSENDCQ